MFAADRSERPIDPTGRWIRQARPHTQASKSWRVVRAADERPTVTPRCNAVISDNLTVLDHVANHRMCIPKKPAHNRKKSYLILFTQPCACWPGIEGPQPPGVSRQPDAPYTGVQRHVGKHWRVRPGYGGQESNFPIHLYFLETPPRWGWGSDGCRRGRSIDTLPSLQQCGLGQRTIDQYRALLC